MRAFCSVLLATAGGINFGEARRLVGPEYWVAMCLGFACVWWAMWLLRDRGADFKPYEKGVAAGIRMGMRRKVTAHGEAAKGGE